MTTRFPGPIHRSPDLGERLVAALPAAVTICKHLFFVLLAAGAAAYVVSLLYVTAGMFTGASAGRQPELGSTNALRSIAWVLGAIVGIVWRYRIWSKYGSQPREDRDPGLAARAKAAATEAAARIARHAALMARTKPAQVIRSLRHSGRARRVALASAFRAAGSGAVFGLIVGGNIGIPLAVAVWSIALSPLVPADWAEFAMYLGTDGDAVVAIAFAVIFGFALLGALLLFVLDIIAGATVEAESKDGDIT